MLAIGCDRRVPTAAGPLRADEIAKRLPQRTWQRLLAGPGAKGERFYDRALITLHPPTGEPADEQASTGCWWLLVRRHRRSSELAF